VVVVAVDEGVHELSRVGDGAEPVGERRRIFQCFEPGLRVRIDAPMLCQASTWRLLGWVLVIRLR